MRYEDDAQLDASEVTDNRGQGGGSGSGFGGVSAGAVVAVEASCRC